MDPARKSRNPRGRGGMIRFCSPEAFRHKKSLLFDKLGEVLSGGEGQSLFQLRSG
jgi:hypothetical protein